MENLSNFKCSDNTCTQILSLASFQRRHIATACAAAAAVHQLAADCRWIPTVAQFVGCSSAGFAKAGWNQWNRNRRWGFRTERMHHHRHRHHFQRRKHPKCNRIIIE